MQSFLWYNCLMQFKNYNVYFFFAILIAITTLVFFMLKPFFIPFILAVILAHAFNPVYEKLLKLTGRKRGLSSALVCLLVAFIIIIPISFVLYLVISEVQMIIDNFSQSPESVKNSLDKFIGDAASLRIFRALDIRSLVNQETISTLIKNFSQNALGVLSSVYSGTVQFIFTVFIMFFSLFYIFIDGKKLVKKLMELSPLKDSYEETLIKKFNSITRGTIRGIFLIAAIQGALGAVLFWVTGIPSPAFLGILMGVASVIPSIGTGLVWLPVGIIMLVLGNVTVGVIILVAGVLIIGTVDNILSPKLIGKDSQMHPLLILFSILGGIVLFGAMGFIVGPIIMSLFVVFWEIYSLEFKNQLEKYNQ